MRLALLAAALVLAACGSDSTAPPKQSPDQRAAGAVATRYTQAIARKDWKTACATRTAAERQQLATNFGTCEKALARAFKGKNVGAFKGVKVARVHIKDGVAGVQMVAPGGLGGLQLAAVRDHGAWRLKNLPDDQIP
jgi:hypothetical protein